MTPRFDGWAEKVRTTFGRQGMMQALSAEMTDLAPGRCKIAAPFPDRMRQHHGYAHAAVTFALGDTSAGFAALTLMEEADEVLTAEMKINLLAPAAGERLIGRGRVIRPGRRLTIVTAEVWAEADGREVQVALLQGTMMPVPG
ncbi:PaaI family thioesterase [Psychromarinibacter sp. C21-152]|uniref:PaaI family thioesterase n=1 Tax=Psychromarinibacter sediminicola TaxID=3033385 RepID=A0AAE3NPP1_9RHOB|nr:PaaI family thioesterase [Psychromarinibacter sediminicola]MDF0599816.1 PaaI family thioesterase [Psychromarinibacter sediminicola]